jgi:hypothetical protein
MKTGDNVLISPEVTHKSDLSSYMLRRETLNNANAVKRMTETFGHSNNFATLSLISYMRSLGL